MSLSMPDAPSPSFIPKRNPSQPSKTKAPRRVYLFSYVAYILIFGAVVSAGAVFVYKLKMEATVLERQRELTTQVDSFSTADLERVKEFERRLAYATARMNNHYSMARLLTSIESMTAATVQFKEVEVEREGDSTMVLSGHVLTDSLNSAIFQRDITKNKAVVSARFVEDVELASEEQLTSPLPVSDSTAVDFVLVLELDLSELTYQGVAFDQPAGDSFTPSSLPERTVPGTAASDSLEANTLGV